MSTLEKAKKRLLALPKDYRFSEARQLLCQLGFKEDQKGKTSGSRVRFYREKDGKIILLHKPHPDDIMGRLTVKDLADNLKASNDL